MRTVTLAVLASLAVSAAHAFSAGSTASDPRPAPRRIAVVGGGLAGLACAYHLLNTSDALGLTLERLDVIDPFPAGEGGASAVAAGLLHPFSPKSRELWRGADGFDAAQQLIAAVEDVVGVPVSCRTGLLRLALDDRQAAVLEASANERREGALLQRIVGEGEAGRLAGSQLGSELAAASHAPNCVSVDTPAYLRGLWEACGRLGGQRVSWRLESVEALRSLSADDGAYDAVVVAAGAKCTGITELRGLPLRACRGQNLILRDEDASLKLPLISGKYVLPMLGSEGKLLLAGATFEYDGEKRVHRGAEPAQAEEALRGAVGRLLPAASDALPLVGCQAGVRALPPRSHFGYVPLAGRLPPLSGMGPEAWMLCGLGSRGLIHHALLGKELALAVLWGDEAMLSPHVCRLAPRLRAMLQGTVK